MKPNWNIFMSGRIFFLELHNSVGRPSAKCIYTTKQSSKGFGLRKLMWSPQVPNHGVRGAQLLTLYEISKFFQSLKGISYSPVTPGCILLHYKYVKNNEAFAGIFLLPGITWFNLHPYWISPRIFHLFYLKQFIWISIVRWPVINKYTRSTATAVNNNSIVIM